MRVLSIFAVLMLFAACARPPSDGKSPPVVESNLDLKKMNENAPPFDERKRRQQLNRKWR